MHLHSIHRWRERVAQRNPGKVRISTRQPCRDASTRRQPHASTFNQPRRRDDLGTLHHYACIDELAETDAIAVMAEQSWVWGQGREEEGGRGKSKKEEEEEEEEADEGGR